LELGTITTRLGVDSDQKYLVEWLLQPSVLDGFPLADLREVEDAARIWISYARFGAVLTALIDGVPCGIANLYIQPYKKMSHQSLFAIIIDEKYRGRGIGTRLLNELFDIAKNQFKMELLHLEVYEGNPAMRLYERMGFVRYGVQRHFVKDEGIYKAKIMMQKTL
jgi:RimJ/RimL family protein N-acetyltransferase